MTEKYQEVILRVLKNRYEGKCSKHGYIVKGSVELFNVSKGRAETTWLNGTFAFPVEFYADVCNPNVGSVVRGRVVNTNRFGVLVEVGVPSKSGQGYVPVMEVVVTKHAVGFQSEVELDTLKENDWVYVEIMGRKYEVNDTHIMGVGRVIKDAKPRIAAPVKLEDEENEDVTWEDEGSEVDGESSQGEAAKSEDSGDELEDSEAGIDVEVDALSMEGSEAASEESM
jgi:DNA-directed RNA polymerase subunit E'/Rpb7